MNAQSLQRKLSILDVQERLRKYLRAGFEEFGLEMHAAIKDVMQADNVVIIVENLQTGGNEFWFSTKVMDEKDVSKTVIDKAMAQGFYYAEISDSNITESQYQNKIKYCCAAAVETGAVRDARIGAIYCDVRVGFRKYAPEDALFLRDIADHLAVYVEHLALLRENEKIRLRTESAVKTTAKYPKATLQRIVGKSPLITEVREQAKRIAVSQRPVLILGETGTGKSSLARVIHDLSPRCGKNFVAVGCMHMTKELIGSELFGHAKGAFTGAYVGRGGLVMQADGGTLFLDEIGDLPLELQGHLHTALDTGKIRQLGSDKEAPVNFRLICATNRNLEAMVQDGTFRSDLYFRISSIGFTLPPLRERKEDIELLAESFAGDRLLTPEAVDFLHTLSYPGNVRQLEELILVARDISSTPGRMEVADLKAALDLNPHGKALTTSRQSDLIERVTSGKMTFNELRDLWNNKRIQPQEFYHLFEFLFRKYKGKGIEIGELLGIKPRTQEMRSLFYWINYLHNSGQIPKPARFRKKPLKQRPRSLNSLESPQPLSRT